MRKSERKKKKINEKDVRSCQKSPNTGKRIKGKGALWQERWAGKLGGQTLNIVNPRQLETKFINAGGGRSRGGGGKETQRVSENFQPEKVGGPYLGDQKWKVPTVSGSGPGGLKRRNRRGEVKSALETTKIKKISLA